MTVQKGVGNQPLNLHQICLDEASVAAYRIGLDGRLLETNKAASEQTGYSREELSSMSIFDIDKGASPERFEEIGRMIREKGALKFTSRFTKKDGTDFPAEITTSIAAFEGSEFAVSFVHDISDREKLQEELRLTQFCFDNASLAIYRIRSSDGKIITTNKKASEQTGYTREELCAMSVPDLDPTFSMDKRDEYQDRLNTEGPYTVESVHRHKNGAIFPVEILVDHIAFEKNEYHLTFVTDITERKKAEKDRSRIKTRLIHSQKMEALGTLAGGIAHDFNNILSGILGYATLAKRASIEDSNISRYIHQILTAGMRAKDLVGQILAFSRRTMVLKAPVDIGLIVKEVIKLLQVSLPSAIEIRHSIPSNLGMVLADGIQIHQLVMNLCTNACHAMKDKGGILKLTLLPRSITEPDLTVDGRLEPGRYLELMVSDSGHGMDEETLLHMFDPYFTTKDVGEGTGLGLSVVHGIVKGLGGGIKVRSKPRAGTEFCILFPVTDREPEQETPEQGALPTGNEHILFVDDEEALTEFGKDLLEDLGYSVETRSNGDDSLEAVRMHPGRYALLITDMIMPGMAGDKLATEIKKIQPDIRIILCTGFSALPAADHLDRAGIQRVLMKPVTVWGLADAVREILDDRP